MLDNSSRTWPMMLEMTIITKRSPTRKFQNYPVGICFNGGQWFVNMADDIEDNDFYKRSPIRKFQNFSIYFLMLDNRLPTWPVMLVMTINTNVHRQENFKIFQLGNGSPTMLEIAMFFEKFTNKKFSEFFQCLFQRPAKVGEYGRWYWGRWFLQTFTINVQNFS